MKSKKIILPLLVVGVIVGLAAMIFTPGGILNFGFEPMQVLPENTAPIVESSKLEGPAENDTKIRFVVGLSLQNEAQLETYLRDVDDPNSSVYGQYLTPQDFLNQYSPSPQNVTKVISYLVDHQMTVLSVSPNRTLIFVEGTVAQIESAFLVEMNRYSIDQDGVRVEYVSNASDPSIPKRLDTIVDGIVGLNTFGEYKSKALENKEAKQPKAPGPPMGLSPQDVAEVYDYPNVNNKNATSVLSGKGTTIAIATAHIYDQKDLDEFYKQFKIVRTGKIKNIHINGKSTTVNSETTLDLQAASSQAPGADILMYMSVDPKFVNFIATFNQVVTDNDADVMSVSWGLCEANTGKSLMKIENKIFKQAHAQGIATFVASGDFGAYDCREAPKKDKNGKDITPPLNVDYPSSDPYTVAVGGTTMFESKGKRLLEFAWDGSGGGESSHWKRPGWQHGPGVPSSKMRLTADVALNADPMTGYAFRFQGRWVVYGGTSVGAPKWAALWALMDEAAGKRIGNPNKHFYEIGRSNDYGKTFHDITSGDNGNNWGPGYKAGKYWDHPTGWGVPKGQALHDWVVKNLKAKP